MRVVLTYDDREVQNFLKAWQEPAVKATLGAAASAYGRAVKPIIQAATPVAPPGNKYVTQGNLQRVTSYRRMRARHGIGVVVGPMSGRGKTAFYRHMVTSGTKPHLIQPKSKGGKLKTVFGVRSFVRHPGAKANPYVARAGRAAEQIGFAAAERVIFAGLAAQRIRETTDS